MSQLVFMAVATHARLREGEGQAIWKNLSKIHSIWAIR